MLIQFPRNVRIDIDNVPEDFDEIIRNTFRDYTAGTRREYMYQDKLLFIDICAKLLHKANDEEQAIKELILKQAEFELDEYGDFPDKDEFWNMGFMCDCYRQGMQDMLYLARAEGIMEMAKEVVKVIEELDECS